MFINSRNYKNLEQKWGKLSPYLEQNRGKFTIN